MSLTLPGPALAAPPGTAPAALGAGPPQVTALHDDVVDILPAVPAAPPTTPLAPHDPLPLPTAGWGVADALDALAEARLALAVPLPDPAVVSALTTVVLRAGDHAVKVYPPGTDPEHLDRTARGLAGTTTALLPVAAPVVTSHGVVGVSPWLPATEPVTWAETGALLRRFHADHADADVAPWQPLRRLLAQAADLPDDVADVLLDARAALLAALDGLHSPLGVGTVHGDVSPANVLHAPGGRALLIDLDFVARAPREYDLTSAARRRDSGELDAATYRGFCDAYGADVRDWDGRVVLDRIARLGGVAFRVWDDRRQGAPLDWLTDAVAAWRTPL